MADTGPDKQTLGSFSAPERSTQVSQLELLDPAKVLSDRNRLSQTISGSFFPMLLKLQSAAWNVARESRLESDTFAELERGFSFSCSERSAQAYCLFIYLLFIVTIGCKCILTCVSKHNLCSRAPWRTVVFSKNCFERPIRMLATFISTPKMKLLINTDNNIR